jgi:hypothetical protein
MVMVLLALVPVGAMAYTINDAVPDAVGSSIFETYGIDVSKFTPGVNNGGITLNLHTNYPQAGTTINGSPPWGTVPADIFITENYYGVDYQWAVPLVSHDGFAAGTTYAVGSFATSTNLDPSGGTGYIYNQNVPVQISALGENYGLNNLGPGSVAWSAAVGSPDYLISVVLGWWEDDPFATLDITWGTATCANDVVNGIVGGGGNPNVPIPPSVLLLGTGLLGLVGVGWNRKRQAA